MSKLGEHISATAEQLDLSSEEFKLVSREQAMDVVKRIGECFIQNTSTIWWWDSLKRRSLRTVFRGVAAYQLLHLLVPPDQTTCWFLAGADESDVNDPLVYEGNVVAIESIIRESYFFEYYLVGKQFDWLLCENHHGVLVAVGLRVVRRLRHYMRHHPEAIAHSYTASPAS